MPEWIRIRIRDFYKNPVGEKEYVCVSKDVYDVLVDEFRKEEHAQEMKGYRHLTRGGYLEGVTEELAFEKDSCLEDIIIYRMNLEILNKAIQSFPDKHMERLCLYYFYDLNLCEIAKLCGVTEKAVRKSIKKSLKKIKNFFEN